MKLYKALKKYKATALPDTSWYFSHTAFNTSHMFDKETNEPVNIPATWNEGLREDWEKYHPLSSSSSFALLSKIMSIVDKELATKFANYRLGRVEKQIKEVLEDETI